MLRSCVVVCAVRNPWSNIMHNDVFYPSANSSVVGMLEHHLDDADPWNMLALRWRAIKAQESSMASSDFANTYCYLSDVSYLFAVR